MYVESLVQFCAVFPNTLDRRHFKTHFKVSPAPRLRNKFGHSSSAASKTLYEYYNAVDLRRGQRFASAMAGHYNTPLDDPIESIYPFNVLRDNALVVDIGGGKGHHSIRLAEKYEMMSFIVQDQTSVVETVQTENLPQSVAGRIEWQAHDLHSPQPVQGADVYILSHIMMDNQPGCVKKIDPRYLGAIINACFLLAVPAQIYSDMPQTQ
ncbi:unnamed protein product [Aspergillus oryzae]|nr:unnamed protein product [Aspergillus oryzae]GMF83867.1 unnamed protein product [Aspergillus oryzae]GMG12963.1 unnamed protein product [Aspergillus oryzae]